MSASDLTLLTSTLVAFTPPYILTSSSPFSADPEMFSDLLQADFDALEESCTHIESLSLDVEDVRLFLAREFQSPSKHTVGSSLRSILDFIEKGESSPLWANTSEGFDTPRKNKAFDMCKAALIKTVVEVAGEEGAEKSLWDESDEKLAGGEFVHRMVGWLKGYVSDMDAGKGIFFDRIDLAICASLSLGNLTRRGWLNFWSAFSSLRYVCRKKCCSAFIISSFIGACFIISTPSFSFDGYQGEAWCTRAA